MRLICPLLVPLLPDNATAMPAMYPGNGDTTDDNLSDDEVLNGSVASAGHLSIRFNSSDEDGVSSNMPDGQDVDGESPGMSKNSYHYICDFLHLTLSIIRSHSLHSNTLRTSLSNFI